MEELDLKNILSTVWNKKYVIILIIVVFLIVGFVYAKNFVKPSYNASTTLVLTTTNKDININTITSKDITINSKLITTYKNLIKSKSLLTNVSENLNNEISIDELSKSISVENVSGTQLIEIKVTNKNKNLVAKIANEVTTVFINQIEELYNINNVQLISEAKEPNNTESVNLSKELLKFALLGVVVSAGYIFIVTFIDSTVKSAEQVEKKYMLPVIATIPLDKEKNENELVMQSNINSPNAEIFRTLRTNIQFMNSNKNAKTLLITSTYPKEGKSWVSANLAISFAQDNKRVILIDADMRKGRQNKIFKVSSKMGLSNYLSGISGDNMELGTKIEEIKSCINNTEIKNLDIITTGPIPPNPSELLASDKMKELIKNLKSMYDIVIIDGTPSKLVTDSIILSTDVDNTILIANYRKTKMEEIGSMINNINNVRGNIVGIILNKVKISNRKYYQNYYYNKNKN